MKSFTLEKTANVQMMFFDSEVKLLEVRDLEISYSMVTYSESADTADLETAQISQNISFAKTVAFIESSLQHAIVVESEIPALGLELDNNIVVLPDFLENTFCSALHCKLNTISGPNTHVEKLKVSDKSDNIVYTLTSDDLNEDYGLPTINEWLGEFPYWNVPWWYRDDITTFDRAASTSEELKAWQKEKKEQKIDEKNYALFSDIEEDILRIYKEAYRNIDSSAKGELIEIDFQNRDKK